MHVITHLLLSILISIVISLKYDVSLIGFLTGILSGTLLDLDHLYNYVRYHGTPTSIREIIQEMTNSYKQPPDSAVRYHTMAHELVGMFFFAIVSILVGYFYSLVYAFLIFLPVLGHFVLDALSVRMMFFSPFSGREFFIGLLKPNSLQEKLIIIILATTITSLVVLKALN